MLGVIIVDDRPDIVEYLAELVPWKQLDCQVLGTAVNGEKAFRLVEETSPEIVITDIRMPIMDGLQFVEKCRDRKKNIRFIILSGYDDFSYAQKSIRLGVDEYLLKPIKIDEICAAVRVLADRIKKDRIRNKETEQLKIRLAEREQLLKDHYFQNLVVRAQDIDLVYVNKFFHMLGLNIPSEGILLAVVRFKMSGNPEAQKEDSLFTVCNILNQVLKSHYLFEIFRYSYCEIAVLFQEKTASVSPADDFEVIRQKAADAYDIELQIEFSKRLPALSDLPDAFHYVMEKLRMRGVQEPESQKTNKPAIYINYQHMEEELIHYIRTDNEIGVKKILDQFFTCNHGISLKSLRKGVWEIYMIVKHYIVPEFEASDAWETIPYTVEELKAWLLESCHRINELQKEKRTGGYIADIKYIVEHHYGENISLAFVSQMVGLTPTYLSALFKEETGETFTEYVVSVRVKKAKELLKTRQMKIYEIAQAVGYTDVRYFGEVFKKNTGKTPKEYQNS